MLAVFPMRVASHGPSLLAGQILQRAMPVVHDLECGFVVDTLAHVAQLLAEEVLLRHHERGRPQFSELLEKAGAQKVARAVALVAVQVGQGRAQAAPPAEGAAVDVRLVDQAADRRRVVRRRAVAAAVRVELAVVAAEGALGAVQVGGGGGGAEGRQVKSR